MLSGSLIDLRQMGKQMVLLAAMKLAYGNRLPAGGNWVLGDLASRVFSCRMRASLFLPVSGLNPDQIAHHHGN